MDSPVGKNVRMFRMAHSMTQEGLAAQSGLSLSSIRNIEHGLQMPRARALSAISHALNEPLHALVREPKVLNNVYFQSERPLKKRDWILNETAIWLKQYTNLEGLLNQRSSDVFEQRSVEARLSSNGAWHEAMRHILELQPQEPVDDLCGRLENAGIKVLGLAVESSSFHGLAVGTEDGGPAIVLNTHASLPVERWVFDAARLFAHVCRNPAAPQAGAATQEDVERIEREACEFAGLLLAPSEALVYHWGQLDGLGLADRILKMKRRFRVSWKLVIARLEEEGLVSNEADELFAGIFRETYGKSLVNGKEQETRCPASRYCVSMTRNEPFGMEAVDFMPKEMRRLVRMALERELITVSRAAEYTGISLQAMRERIRTWHAAEPAALG
ncbi:MAG: ImmA/IrrE family metallo-endopeptidase [Candidatus Hydrogenedentes bacterium]|nr:ImmA/IrrE family metallo-endopeptidase [Candidatus Hydrogenedentota bacterium]